MVLLLPSAPKTKAGPPPVVNEWQSAVSSGEYPVLEREHVLSEFPLCGALRLDPAWKEKQQQKEPRLLPNDPCPNAANLQKLPKEEGKSSKKKLTLFMIYYENIPLLSEQIDSWLAWPDEIRRQMDFLIIDDGSQVGARAMDLIWPHRDYLLSRLDLEVYEVEQDLSWNIGGARNLAAAVAKTEYLFLSDVDLLVDAPTATFLLTLLQEAETTTTTTSAMTVFNLFDRLRSDKVTHKPHPAVMLSSKKLYWAIGGCDEDFVGNYGHTDVHFFYRAGLTEGVRVVGVEKRMKQEGIPPIREIDEGTCPAWAKPTCDQLPRELTKRKRTRNTKANAVLFGDKKKKKKTWSNEYLRFGFHKAILQPPPR